MNRELQKQKTIDAVISDLAGFEDGFFLTLNAIYKDQEKFEEQLKQMIHWLNDKCYGRAYINGSRRLRVVATTEIGDINQGLHAHIVVMFNRDMVKSFEELKTFISSKWYKLIGAKGSIRGNLVNIQPVGDLNSRVEYIHKTYYHNHQELNPLYF